MFNCGEIIYLFVFPDSSIFVSPSIFLLSTYSSVSVFMLILVITWCGIPGARDNFKQNLCSLALLLRINELFHFRTNILGIRREGQMLNFGVVRKYLWCSSTRPFEWTPAYASGLSVSFVCYYWLNNIHFCSYLCSNVFFFSLFIVEGNILMRSDSNTCQSRNNISNVQQSSFCFSKNIKYFCLQFPFMSFCLLLNKKNYGRLVAVIRWFF